uniref:Ribosomal_L12 domain-containing protein n=1 Tax=Gongylonema pulchrum TaxID=637853 RepID=A0A183DVQ2_9BILA
LKEPEKTSQGPKNINETVQQSAKVEKTTDSQSVAAGGVQETLSARLPMDPGKPAPLPPRDGERVISERILRLADQIASLSIFEVADLNATLKKKLNLPDTPMFASAGFTQSAAPSAAEAEPQKEEQTQASQKTFFSVKLTKYDDSKKIPLIKEVRTIVEGFNLVQAKKFVESLPATVKEDLSKIEAEELKEKLEKLGAVCEIV